MIGAKIAMTISASTIARPSMARWLDLKASQEM
jgi:hypothetical protein